MVIAVRHTTAVHDVESSVWHEPPASEHGKAELVYYKTQNVTAPDDCGHDLRILTEHYKESRRSIVQARCGEAVRASSAYRIAGKVIRCELAAAGDRSQINGLQSGGNAASPLF